MVVRAGARGGATGGRGHVTPPRLCACGRPAAGHRHTRCWRCINRQRRNPRSPARLANIRKWNALRIRVGRSDYLGSAATPEDAQRITAHARRRLHEFTSRRVAEEAIDESLS